MKNATFHVSTPSPFKGNLRYSFLNQSDLKFLQKCIDLSRLEHRKIDELLDFGVDDG